MTVSTSNSQTRLYRGDGISTVFAVGFPFLENEHLHVVMTDAANEVCLVPDVDYHVIATEAGDGQVVLVQPLAVGKMLTISRKVPVTQLMNYVQGDAFPAKQHETALDKLTMIAQELTYEVGRAVKLPETNEGEFVLPSVSQRKNALLGFGAGGLPQVVKVGDGLITARHMLMVNANMGIISNAAGVSVLIGDGLGAYNSVIVIKPGDGLDFDTQTQLRLKAELLDAINRNTATLIDLRGMLSNLMRRIVNLEMEGGTEVTIYIGEGVRYDEDGNLTVKPGMGIEVNVDGVHVLLGEGLEVGEQGQVQISYGFQHRVNLLEKRVDESLPKFAIIYPNGGSEASPADVQKQQRYVMSNPFAGHHVNCMAEILVDGKWGWPGLYFGRLPSDGMSYSCGAQASQLEDDIVLVTGSYLIMDVSTLSLTPHQTEALSSAPCRIKVWRID